MARKKLYWAIQLIHQLINLAVGGGDLAGGEGLAGMGLQDVAKAVESGKRRRGSPGGRVMEGGTGADHPLYRQEVKGEGWALRLSWKSRQAADFLWW